MIEDGKFADYLRELRQKIQDNPNDRKSAKELERLLESKSATRKVNNHNSVYQESIRSKNDLV